MRQGEGDVGAVHAPDHQRLDPLAQSSGGVVQHPAVDGPPLDVGGQVRGTGRAEPHGAHAVDCRRHIRAGHTAGCGSAVGVCSQANRPPVRPKPTAISLAMRWTPCWSHRRRTSRRQGGSCIATPAAHRATGFRDHCGDLRPPLVQQGGHRQRPRGRAVVAPAQADELPFAGQPPGAPVVETHLQRNLHGRSPVAGVKAMVDDRAGMRRQALRQLDGRRVGAAGQHRKGQAIEPGLDRVFQRGIGVAEQVDPAGTEGVEAALAFVVIQPGTEATGDGQGRYGLEPPHLGAGMPDGSGAAGLPRSLEGGGRFVHIGPRLTGSACPSGRGLQPGAG